jgi:hypothetical protein
VILASKLETDITEDIMEERMMCDSWRTEESRMIEAGERRFIRWKIGNATGDRRIHFQAQGIRVLSCINRSLVPTSGCLCRRMQAFLNLTYYFHLTLAPHC